MDVEREIRRMDRDEQRIDQQRRMNERSFTDLGIDPDIFPDGKDRRLPKLQRGARPYVWEGPRFEFLTYLGSGETWNGPGQKDFCRGRHLNRDEYCLSCDRCGRDAEIPRPPKQKKSARYPHRRGKLKGGTG